MKIIFMGTFTAAGLKTQVADGKLNIVQEGRVKKFVEKCPKISFVAEQYLRNHESFLFITERCVIRRTAEGMILEEIAPGISIENDILAHCDARLIIPEGGPRLMDAALFSENDFTL